MTETTSDAVLLRLPASSAYLSVLRTATASLASRVDFTLDEIEDLRIAVDEACALLLPHAAEGAELECAFTLAPDLLAVSISVEAADTGQIAHDSFAWTVLTALAGEVTSESEGGRMRLALVKHKAPPP